MDGSVREKLRGETMAAAWGDLVYQFARGGLLLVTTQLDLLDVATAIATDAREQVEHWLATGAVRKASDEDAQRFQSEPNVRFQFVIVQPWVLAQRLG